MRTAAFVIICNQRHEILLCLRRDKSLWNLPGGGSVIGEAPWQTALRETKEELEVDIELLHLHSLAYKPKEDELVFTWYARIIAGEPSTSDEVATYDYFPLQALPANMAPLQKQRLLFTRPGIRKKTKQQQLWYPQ